MKEKVLFEGQF